MTRNGLQRFFSNNFLLLITIGLFAAMYIMGMITFQRQDFHRLPNFLNLFISNAGLIIAAAGMTIVLICGGIDISVGSVVGLTCMLLAWMMEKQGVNAYVAIGIVLAFGTLFGLFQGFLVSYLKIQPFIVTLAGLFMARGLTAVISANMITITNPDFLGIAKKMIYLPFGSYVNRRGVEVVPFIYPSVILAIVVIAVVFVMLRYTKFGRSIYAVGGNEQSARLMGLNVRRTKLKVYVLNGFLASLGGLAVCLGSTGGFVEQARGFEMDAIASTVIGGTLLTGGVGNVIGSLFGVFIRGTIQTLINFDGTLITWWVSIIIAALLAFFIILQSLFAAVKRKKTK